MRHFIRLANVAAMLFMVTATALPQGEYPRAAGDRSRHDFSIEMPKAYVGGILLMLREDESNVRGSLVNEFGISLLDFNFDEKKGKVKIESILKVLDKWYIRRVLRSDLKESLQAIERGDTIYNDTRHKITFRFRPAAAPCVADTITTDSDHDIEE